MCVKIILSLFTALLLPTSRLHSLSFFFYARYSRAAAKKKTIWKKPHMEFRAASRLFIYLFIPWPQKCHSILLLLCNVQLHSTFYIPQDNTSHNNICVNPSCSIERDCKIMKKGRARRQPEPMEIPPLSHTRSSPPPPKTTRTMQ
jgi:hypothetical protein